MTPEERNEIDRKVREIVNDDLDRLFMVASVLAPIAEDITPEGEAEDIIVDLGSTVIDN